MIHYFSAAAVCLNTDRVSIRTTQPTDAFRLAEYYSDNFDYLAPWEPKRDKSYCYPNSWQIRLSMLAELHAQGAGRHFIMLDKAGSETIGVINFSHIIRGDFHACYLGYSIAEKWQGQGLMFEALQATIRHMFNQHNLHRIMANYMPYNQRSGRLLARLGFVEEGYAKDYLMINGMWQDHILTALINPQWRKAI